MLHTPDPLLSYPISYRGREILHYVRVCEEKQTAGSAGGARTETWLRTSAAVCVGVVVTGQHRSVAGGGQAQARAVLYFFSCGEPADGEVGYVPELRAYKDLGMVLPVGSSDQRCSCCRLQEYWAEVGHAQYCE